MTDESFTIEGVLMSPPEPLYKKVMGNSDTQKFRVSFVPATKEELLAAVAKIEEYEQFKTGTTND